MQITACRESKMHWNANPLAMICQRFLSFCLSAFICRRSDICWLHPKHWMWLLEANSHWIANGFQIPSYLHSMLKWAHISYVMRKYMRSLTNTHTEVSILSPQMVCNVVHSFQSANNTWWKQESRVWYCRISFSWPLSRINSGHR